MNIKNLSWLLVALAATAVFIGLNTNSLDASPAKEGWLLDFEEAKAKAKEEGKIILLEFHGSDWCPPCIRLNKEVLSKPEFKEFADKNLVLVDLDFPRQTELSEEQSAHNHALAQRFGVQYFPTVVLVTPDGDVLDHNVGFPQGGLEGFIQFIQAQIEG
ncbi:MAG: thioredoxin family protein [Opitutales bacterium]|nr:thioredoxin family protein [Opitutales bacterium]